MAKMSKIGEAEFVELFRNLVKKGVFRPEALAQLRGILEQGHDPFLDVIGISADGKLAASIDTELYGLD
jgi:hypothetical protein